jgi:uncharacterized coiled-coil protein SlyX
MAVSMSILTDILDRLSGIAALKERVIDQQRQLEEVRRVVIDQQKEVAEVKGQLKALITIQSQMNKSFSSAPAPASRRSVSTEK